VEQTLYFLFLKLQLSLHVRERGLNLLEVLVRFGVCDIKIFMLPLFFSVKVSWTRSEERDGTHSEESLTQKRAPTPSPLSQPLRLYPQAYGIWGY
jgi:hypothetical protein